MKPWLVRLALLSYPSAWRRRYGAELTQLITDCAAEATMLGSARLLIEASGSGILERFGGVAPRTRQAFVVCLCAAAGMAVDAGVLSSQESLTHSPPPLGTAWLGPDALASGDVLITYAQPWRFPQTARQRPRRITVQLVPGSSRVVGISGPPATVDMNPKTGEITAIKPRA